MCSKLCLCLTFVFIFTISDILLNVCLFTHGFQSIDNFQNITLFADSILDVWIISIIRDLFLFIVSLVVIINTRACHSFVKYVHRKYLSALMCLIMYAFAMIKLLFHSDNRQTNGYTVAMLIWNIIASFLFFICWYSMSLLKVTGYKKTNVDGGDAENGEERDIFLDTIKETQKKRSSLFRLFRYSKYDWHYILIGTIFLIGSAVAEAFVPYYTGQVLDSILVQQNFGNFKRMFSYFCGANFISGFIGGLRTCMFSIAFARLNIRLRKLLFNAIVKQEVAFFDKTNTGDMLSRLSSDTTSMSDLIAQNLNGFLWHLLRTMGTLMFIFKLSWQLSLICFIGAPIVFAVGELYGKYYKNLASKATKRMAESNHVAEETISTIRTVRSFANEEGEFKRYYKTLREMYKLKFKQALIYSTYDWAVKLAQLGMTTAMFIYGAHLVVTNQITSGDFMSFVIYQLTLGSCLEGLTSVYTGLMSAAGASEKVFEYLDKKTDPDLAATYKTNDVNGEIEFKNVTFSYPTRPDIKVLQDVSFTVKPGEVVALVGPSGSGKSSCVSLLERFYKPEEGDITIDGVSVRTFDHKCIHEAIALVSQEPVLYARTIKENIAYALEDVPMETIINAAQTANAHNFIMETTDEYNTMCGERGMQLSGGQKQRIAIARALIRNPRILLLDEATSALDAESEFLVQQAIHKHLKGHTVIVVAHRLSTIENADKIIVLDHGRIIEQGNHRELLKLNGLYAHLVDKQLHGNNQIESQSQSKCQSGASTPQIPSSSQVLSFFNTSDDHNTSNF